MIGILIIGLGILYREITILTIDKDDYDTLDYFGVYRYRQRKKLSSTARAFIVRFFFLITLDAWLVYKVPHILSSQSPFPFFPLDIIPYSIIYGTVFFILILYFIKWLFPKEKEPKISKERRTSLLLRIEPRLDKPFLVDFAKTSLEQKWRGLLRRKYRGDVNRIEQRGTERGVTEEDIMSTDYPEDILENLYKIFVKKELSGRGLEWRFSFYMRSNTNNFNNVANTLIPYKLQAGHCKKVKFDILGTDRNERYRVWIRCKNNFSPVTIQEISKFLIEVQKVINFRNVWPDRIIFLSPACYTSTAVEYVKEFGYVAHQNNEIPLELWKEFGKEFRPVT